MYAQTTYRTSTIEYQHTCNTSAFHTSLIRCSTFATTFAAQLAHFHSASMVGLWGTSPKHWELNPSSRVFKVLIQHDVAHVFGLVDTHCRGEN